MSLSYGFCLDELSSMYDSAQFSGAFHAVAGDGITSSGARLAMTINGFTATVASGYALAAGRWLSNDEPLALPVQPSENNNDRTDALVVRVDYKARRAALELLADIDPDKLPANLRSEEEYGIVLYLVRVPRGASTLMPENITDCRPDPNLCGSVLPLSAIAGDVLYVYSFLRSGIDQEVDQVLAQGQEMIEQADEAIAKLNKAIQKAGGAAAVGELQTVRRAPGPGWLLCDGSPVPESYPALISLIGSTLPEISQYEDRYRTYMFGGAPA